MTERPDMSSINAFDDIEDESELDKIFERMLSDDNLHHLTQLTREEISAFTGAWALCEKYGLATQKKYLFQNLKLRVSMDRKGRGEFVKIAQRHSDQPNERSSWLSFRRE
jgi:hypothetical protein